MGCVANVSLHAELGRPIPFSHSPIMSTERVESMPENVSLPTSARLAASQPSADASPRDRRPIQPTP